MPDEIRNEHLNAFAVPPISASWQVIGTSALTFNGYKTLGGFKQCAELANRIKREFSAKVTPLRSLSLTELRSCLFFEKRRFNHYGEDPQGDDRAFINSLIEAIREKV